MNFSKLSLLSMTILLFLSISFQSCQKQELDGAISPAESTLEKGGEHDRGEIIRVKPKP